MARQPGIAARGMAHCAGGNVRVEVWEARWTPGREDETRVQGRVQVFDADERTDGFDLVDVRRDEEAGEERWFEVRESFGPRRERGW